MDNKNTLRKIPAKHGSKSPDLSRAAAAMGRKGGTAKSDAKAATARANGKKGGRPAAKKQAPASPAPDE